MSNTLKKDTYLVVRLGYFSKSSLEVHDLIPSDDSLLMSDPPDTNNIAFSFSSSKASWQC